MPPTTAFDAIILAGGQSAPLGGIAKSGLRYAAKSLLDHAIDAAAAAGQVVVVAPDSVTPHEPTRRVEEVPLHSGPMAAIAAGLDDLARLSPAGWVLILACDYPRSEDAVAALTRGCDFADGIDAYLAVGPDRAPQYLLGIYRRASLVESLSRVGHIGGHELEALVAGLTTAEVELPAELVHDVDDASAAQRFGISLT